MIVLDREGASPLYMQIYIQIRGEILDGVLKEDQILAGSRGLAKTLGVSRNTVDGAYNQLLAEGYIVPKKGIGYAVLKVPKLEPVGKGEAGGMRKDTSEGSPDRNDGERILYDLTNGSHTSDLFPKNLWKRRTLECLELLEREKRLSSAQDKQGERYLRRNLLAYLERIRGVHCREEQIVITCGIQQSLESICRLLPHGMNHVLMEEPGFNKAAAVFHNNSMEICPVPVDADGLTVQTLGNLHRQGPYVIYTTPSHQFPTGVTMPIGRRYELLRWAKETGSYIIEDDFDSEQRYYAKPIPSLQSIDTADRVIYLGTFSKALSPSVRMGYMILPPALLERYLERFENYNSTVPLLNQYVVGRLIETGEYDRHIRRLNHVFRKRMELFQAEFAELGKKIKLTGNGTGQYFLLEFSGAADQGRLIEKALEQGVRVYPTMQFWQDKAECPPDTLFLGFSKIDLNDIPDCVARLKRGWGRWL